MAVPEHVQRKPAPIDAVAPDQTVLDLHDLDKVHLLAFRRGAWIFPGQHAAVAEEALLETLALRWVGLEHLCDEVSQVLLAPDDAVALLQQMLHQRAFDRGVVRIERERGLEVAFAERLVPGAVDALDVLPGSGSCHGYFLIFVEPAATLANSCGVMFHRILKRRGRGTGFDRRRKHPI